MKRLFTVKEDHKGDYYFRKSLLSYDCEIRYYLDKKAFKAIGNNPPFAIKKNDEIVKKTLVDYMISYSKDKDDPIVYVDDCSYYVDPESKEFKDQLIHLYALNGFTMNSFILSPFTNTEVTVSIANIGDVLENCCIETGNKVSTNILFEYSKDSLSVKEEVDCIESAHIPLHSNIELIIPYSKYKRIKELSHIDINICKVFSTEIANITKEYLLYEGIPANVDISYMMKALFYSNIYGILVDNCGHQGNHFKNLSMFTIEISAKEKKSFCKDMNISISLANSVSANIVSPLEAFLLYLQ